MESESPVVRGFSKSQKILPVVIIKAFSKSEGVFRITCLTTHFNSNINIKRSLFFLRGGRERGRDQGIEIIMMCTVYCGSYSNKSVQLFFVLQFSVTV